MWGSFGYFDEAGNLAQARAAARALKPGGRYLIDTPSLESIYPDFRERHTERSSMRIYSLRELTELLREAGFTSFEARDDALEPFELGSHRLWLVARKA
ncbi:MAG TPA: hypothetical protein VF984_14895 [Actinomycetota bacterium]